MKLLGVLSAVAVLLVAAPAGAILIPFEVVEDNSPDAATLGLQLEAEVLDEGGGVISFTIFNDGPTFMGTPLNGIITQVYWDDASGLLDSLDTLPANWSSGANPPNLPGGNTISFDADFSAGADSPSPMNGFDVGESGTFLFSANMGVLFSDIEDALESGSLRLGLHVQATGDDNQFSDSFVSGPPDTSVVPEPATVSLLLMGLAGGAITRFRRKATF